MQLSAPLQSTAAGWCVQVVSFTVIIARCVINLCQADLCFLLLSPAVPSSLVQFFVSPLNPVQHTMPFSWNRLYVILQ